MASGLYSNPNVRWIIVGGPFTHAATTIVWFSAPPAAVAALDPPLIRFSLGIAAILSAIGVVFNFLIRDSATLPEHGEGSVASRHLSREGGIRDQFASSAWCFSFHSHPIRRSGSLW